MAFDLVILTDPNYISVKNPTPFIDNVLLEDRLVADALQKRELRVTRKSWDDPNFDWSSTKYAMFRSTWDYIHRVTEFSDWLQNVSEQTQLINSKKLIEWNFDKHYLLDLEKTGIAIPNTCFIEKGTHNTLKEIHEKAIDQQIFNASTLVLKPCVSGGARHTYKIPVQAIAQYEEVFQDLVTNESMMVQEFQQNIVDQGEISMMVFNGQFAHAVLKVAKSGDFRVQDDFGGSVQQYNASKEEIEFAERTVLSAPELPMYARVDIFRDNDNKLALAELEVFEPELWFRLNPEAANLLAKNIMDTYFN